MKLKNQSFYKSLNLNELSQLEYFQWGGGHNLFFWGGGGKGGCDKDIEVL